MTQPSQWQRLAAPRPQQAASFAFDCAGAEEAGFAIRLQSGFHAYRNRCPHAGTTLDWVPGKFFNPAGLLQCQTHGACFDPGSGSLCSGPAERGLDRLPVRAGGQWIEVPAAFAAPPWPID